jgi:hypothetical protein
LEKVGKRDCDEAKAGGGVSLILVRISPVTSFQDLLNRTTHIWP